MKTVAILTPSHDGYFPIHYLHSLVHSLELLRSKGVNVTFNALCFSALVGVSRDHLFSFAHRHRFDDVFFIDSDMAWEPEDLWKNLQHPADFTGAMYRAKDETLKLMYKALPNPEMKGALAEVEFVGMGLVRLTKNAISRLWDSAKQEYSHNGHTLRELFPVTVEKGDVVGEDVHFCRKWRALGGKIYLDLGLRARHWGNKMYVVPPVEEMVAMAQANANPPRT